MDEDHDIDAEDEGDAPEVDPSAWLAGSLLVAMPQMGDPRFKRSVIYVCAHSAEGAMGIVVNQKMDQIDFAEVVTQLGVDPGEGEETPVVQGGPVESSRGFVLHTADYDQPGTLMINDDFALTATVEVLKAISAGEGPKEALLALGYAGWAPGQLDREIQENGWMIAPGEKELVFDAPLDERWDRAMRAIGVDPLLLSSTAGHA